VFQLFPQVSMCIHVVRPRPQPSSYVPHHFSGASGSRSIAYLQARGHRQSDIVHPTWIAFGGAWWIIHFPVPQLIIGTPGIFRILRFCLPR